MSIFVSCFALLITAAYCIHAFRLSVKVFELEERLKEEKRLHSKTSNDRYEIGLELNHIEIERDKYKKIVDDWEPIVSNGSVANLRDLIAGDGELFRARALKFRKLLQEQRINPGAVTLHLPSNWFCLEMIDHLDATHIYGLKFVITELDCVWATYGFLNERLCVC